MFRNQNKMPRTHITPSFVLLEASGTPPTMAMLLHKEGRSRSKRAYHPRMLVMQSSMPMVIGLCLIVKPVGQMPMKRHSEPYNPLQRCDWYLLLLTLARMMNSNE
jgi:hypothetical protein